MLQQAYTPSNTGIQSFADASADYDLAPIGIGSMQEQVDRLAEFGRNGDIYVVHAAEGETVIPMEVLDSNPQVKEMLFAQMRDMGLDPNEFVVGNELNSINPVTGMPEFFFSSIFRAVKSVVKSVIKVVKKIAPIAIPIAAAAFGVPFLSPTFFGAGSFGASFLGGGIGSLIAGDSIGDALKNGIFSGLTTVAVGGAKGLLPGGGGFLEGATDAFYNPDALTAGQNFSNFSDIFSSDVPGSFGDKTKTFLGLPEAPTADPGLGNVDFTGDFTNLPEAFVPADPSLLGSGIPSSPPLSANALTSAPSPVATPGFDSIGSGGDMDFSGLIPAGPAKAAEVSTLESLFGSTGKSIDEGLTTAGDYLSRGGDSAKDIAGNVAKAKQAYLTDVSKNIAMAKQAGVPFKNIGATTAGLKAAAASAQPGMLAKYGPSLALAGGAAYLGGVFDAPEVEKSDEEREAERQQGILRGPNQLFAAAEREREAGGENEFLVGGGDPDALNPYRYQVERATGSEPSGPFQVASQATQPVDFGRARNRFAPPFRGSSNYGAPPLQGNPYYARYAADGGFIDGQPQYPRREMLVEGPGTERSDDIPAMLSDGEFVLNAQSVRGADPTGQGNRYRGAQNLYSMMRNFEMKG